MVQLQDAQGRLQVGLGLRQLQLDGAQTVGVGGGQVHPQQGQVHLGTDGKLSGCQLETGRKRLDVPFFF